MLPRFIGFPSGSGAAVVGDELAHLLRISPFPFPSCRVPSYPPLLRHYRPVPIDSSRFGVSDLRMQASHPWREKVGGRHGDAARAHHVPADARPAFCRLLRLAGRWAWQWSDGRNAAALCSSSSPGQPLSSPATLSVACIRSTCGGFV
ncbi:hypothetical protein C2845_PM04G32050 [Panicum miliaceum]|uniref:Uncharacterized protein n=1 Tax=Panicum miliaceum TaxID=4540 RepID=A0A3L6QPY4_PANMI|nr:hypothetical protein C2845_PM04G32050 [Panicum miliaceum]